MAQRSGNYEDHREFVLMHGGNLTSYANIVPAGAALGARARLRHTSPKDFQPPYFTHPYNLTQTELDFQRNPYSHLTNSLNASTQRYHHHHQLHTNPRNLLRDENAALHLPANRLPMSYRDARRTGVTSYARRPDIFVHPPHSITDQDLINHHNAGALPILADGQFLRPGNIAARESPAFQGYDQATPSQSWKNVEPSSALGHISFSNLNLNSIDEEDEFLYGDSNSIPGEQIPLQNDSIISNSERIDTRWNDEGNPFSEIWDTSANNLNSRPKKNLMNYSSQNQNQEIEEIAFIKREEDYFEDREIIVEETALVEKTVEETALVEKTVEETAPVEAIPEKRYVSHTLLEFQCSALTPRDKKVILETISASARDKSKNIAAELIEKTTAKKKRTRKLRKKGISFGTAKNLSGLEKILYAASNIWKERKLQRKKDKQLNEIEKQKKLSENVDNNKNYLAKAEQKRPHPPEEYHSRFESSKSHSPHRSSNFDSEKSHSNSRYRESHRRYSPSSKRQSSSHNSDYRHRHSHEKSSDYSTYKDRNPRSQTSRSRSPRSRRSRSRSPRSRRSRSRSPRSRRSRSRSPRSRRSRSRSPRSRRSRSRSLRSQRSRSRSCTPQRSRSRSRGSRSSWSKRRSQSSRSRRRSRRSRSRHRSRRSRSRRRSRRSRSRRRSRRSMSSHRSQRSRSSHTSRRSRSSHRSQRSRSSHRSQRSRSSRRSQSRSSRRSRRSHSRSRSRRSHSGSRSRRSHSRSRSRRSHSRTRSRRSCSRNRSRRSRSRSQSKRSRSRRSRSQSSESHSPRSRKSRSRSPGYYLSSSKTHDKKKSKSSKKSDYYSKKREESNYNSDDSLSSSASSSNRSDERKNAKQFPIKNVLGDNRKLADEITNLKGTNSTYSELSDSPTLQTDDTSNLSNILRNEPPLLQTMPNAVQPNNEQSLINLSEQQQQQPVMASSSLTFTSPTVSKEKKAEKNISSSSKLTRENTSEWNKGTCEYNKGASEQKKNSTVCQKSKEASCIDENPNHFMSRLPTAVLDEVNKILEMDYADDTTEKQRILETEKQDSAELQQKYKMDSADDATDKRCDLETEKQDSAELQQKYKILKDLKQSESRPNVVSKLKKKDKKRESEVERIHRLTQYIEEAIKEAGTSKSSGLHYEPESAVEDNNTLSTNDLDALVTKYCSDLQNVENGKCIAAELRGPIEMKTEKKFTHSDDLQKVVENKDSEKNENDQNSLCEKRKVHFNWRLKSNVKSDHL